MKPIRRAFSQVSITLPNELLPHVKVRAAAQDKNLSQYFRALVRRDLAEKPTTGNGGANGNHAENAGPLIPA